MYLPEWLIQFVADIPPLIGGLALMLSSVLMIVLQDRRASLVLLLVQYVAVALLTLDDLFLPLVLVRLATGLAVCGIVYLTAHRAERRRREERRQESTALGPVAADMEGLGISFRLALAALCVLASMGLWQHYALFSIIQGYGLALLMLLTSALIIIVSSTDPLRSGIGLLMALHGGSVVYLSLEQSFVAVLLLDVLDVLVALTVALMSEAWLQSVEDLGT